jgi:hypothetical protein
MTISISWRDRPFDGAFHHQELPTGGAIAEIIRPLRDLPRGFSEIGEARLNGDLIPRHLWTRVKPKAGTALTFHTPLRSSGTGGGGGSGKGTIAMVATIAVLLAAAAVSGGAAAPLIAAGWEASVAGAAIGIGGRLHIGRTFNE